MSTKLVCRKCQGNHLTIKCGKEKKKETPKTQVKKTYKSSSRTDRHKPKENFCVKISNLPSDVTLKEMTDLILPWSPKKGISRINFNKSEDKICYIDFHYKDEADYFINALNKTKFDYLLLDVNYV